MNIKNLNKVFEHYIEKFEFLNQKPEPDESYKWVAVKNFQTVFKLDVPDGEFADMLYRAWRATENLIDSNQQQPFYALFEYAKREPATVRSMFKNLFSDVGGNLNKQQEKIEAFLLRADELLQKYFPTSHLYVNTQRSVMAYLWFYNPDAYYYYKATEAKYLADCVEFYDDWGTYHNFDLTVYHRFCDEIVVQMKKHSALMETHKSRFDGNEDQMDADEQLHILVMDIIFCSKRYNLYDGIPIKDSSAPARKLYHERKARAQELLAGVESAEKTVNLLNEARKIFADMLTGGAEIVHSMLGKAHLVGFSDGYCTLFFEAKNEQKIFPFLSSLAGGFIKILTPEFEELLEKYRSAMKAELTAARQLELAKKALEPYEEYLD